MTWKIEITDAAEKQLSKIDKTAARRIFKFLNERVTKSDNPRELGKPLKGCLRDYWRYRIGDYRIVCHIDDTIITILVLHIGHRSNIYSNLT